MASESCADEIPASLTDINLHTGDTGRQSTGDGGSPETQVPIQKQKVPRRILHFSDGILEEYSTDEEEEDTQLQQQPPVNPKMLSWLPWFWYQTVHSATRALNVADYAGERLAWMLGITSPKYQYAIDEYNRLKMEEEEEKERDAREAEAIRLRRLQRMDGMEGGEGGGAVNMAYLQSAVDNDTPVEQQQQQQEKY